MMTDDVIGFLKNNILKDESVGALKKCSTIERICILLRHASFGCPYGKFDGFAVIFNI